MISMLLKAANAVTAPRGGRGRFFLNDDGVPCVRLSSGELVQFGAGEVTQEALDAVASAASTAAYAANNATETANNAAQAVQALEGAVNELAGTVAGLGGGAVAVPEWDWPAYMKGRGATNDHANNLLGDYTIGQDFRATRSLRVQAVRIYWPHLTAQSTMTARLYIGGTLQATGYAMAAPGDIVEAPFESPIELSAGQAFMVTVYGGGVGYVHADLTGWGAVPQLPMSSGGCVRWCQTMYATGDAVPTSPSTSGYAPLFWPVAA